MQDLIQYQNLENKWYAKATPIATPDAPVAAPAGVHAFQYHAQDELSNYRYGYANPTSARYSSTIYGYTGSMAITST